VLTDLSKNVGPVMRVPYTAQQTPIFGSRSSCSCTRWGFSAAQYRVFCEFTCSMGWSHASLLIMYWNGSNSFAQILFRSLLIYPKGKLCSFSVVSMEVYRILNPLIPEVTPLYPEVGRWH